MMNRHKGALEDIDKMIEDNKGNDEIIYKFVDDNCNLTTGVARHYKDLGYDIYCSLDEGCRVFGGGDKILIKMPPKN